MAAASPGYSAAQRLRCGTRDDARDALLAARGRTLAIAGAFGEALRHEGMRVQYAPTLNPPLWEAGHIAWFQEAWIARNLRRDLGARCPADPERTPSILPGADGLYDSSRVAHRARWELPLPGEAETRRYLQQTLESTHEMLERLPQDASDDRLYFFRLVAAHEEMHAEAGLYMAGALGIATPPELLRRAAMPPSDSEIAIPAQSFRVGWSGPGFAFDNELAAHDVAIEAFRIDARPVTWGRFLAFDEAGGYERREWWTEAGWSWLQAEGRPRHGTRELDRDAPAAHLTAHEADAWCRWAGRRLPTEAEWECAACTDARFAWGAAWEWTASPFEPYPGFAPHPYRDYSLPWFGARRVLRGASVQTAASLAHPRYRNYFEPQRADIVSGFRSCAAG
jgi:ergothioneine biosynthesis protein EgtB